MHSLRAVDLQIFYDNGIHDVTTNFYKENKNTINARPCIILFDKYLYEQSNGKYSIHYRYMMREKKLYRTYPGKDYSSILFFASHDTISNKSLFSNLSTLIVDRLLESRNRKLHKHKKIHIDTYKNLPTSISTIHGIFKHLDYTECTTLSDKRRGDTTYIHTKLLAEHKYTLSFRVRPDSTILNKILMPNESDIDTIWRKNKIQVPNNTLNDIYNDILLYHTKTFDKFKNNKEKLLEKLPYYSTLSKDGIIDVSTGKDILLNRVCLFDQKLSEESIDNIHNYYYVLHTSIVLLNRNRDDFNNVEQLNTKDSTGSIVLLSQEDIISTIYKKAVLQRSKFIYTVNNEKLHKTETELLPPIFINYNNLYEITYTKRELVYFDNKYGIHTFYDKLNSEELSKNSVNILNIEKVNSKKYLEDNGYSIDKVRENLQKTHRK